MNGKLFLRDIHPSLLELNTLTVPKDQTTHLAAYLPEIGENWIIEKENNGQVILTGVLTCTIRLPQGLLAGLLRWCGHQGRAGRPGG